MNNKIKSLLMIVAFVGFMSSTYAQNYRNATEVNAAINTIAKQNQSSAKVHTLSKTHSGIAFLMLELGTETGQTKKTKPAIFVLGNPQGTVPLASEASLKFAESILKNKKTEQFTWYIIPNLNPESLNHYFAKAKRENSRNARPHNDDLDDAFGEDDFEDLNGDGYITKMRVLDPLGVYVIDETNPLIMRKADLKKGEKGMYKLYAEGIDNDKDGKYNEDPQGGVNNGINFPHLFHSYKNTAGIWPGSEPEVYSIMEFMYKHPEIAATFTFGATDFCIQAPKGGRKGSANFSKIKIPKRFAAQFGADPEKNYTMEEVIELVQPMMPDGMELTPSMVAGFLGLGAAVNPEKEDLSFYNELNKQYKEFLKKQGVNMERLSPKAAKDGSFELWSYYHLGIPTFSMNFFTIEKPTKEKTEKEEILSLEAVAELSSDEFVKLGEDKINEFLKTNNAPKKFNASKIIEMMKGGQLAPKQMVGMLKNMPKKDGKANVDEKTLTLLAYSKNELNGKGFVNWAPYNHPTLGSVEIGGFIPYLESTPKAELIDSLIDVRLPWIYTITEKLANLQIQKQESKSLSGGVFEITVWVTNTSYLPFPTKMGDRNRRLPPAVIILSGKNIELISGKIRTPINSVGGNKTVKHRFLLKADKGTTVNIKLESPNAGNDNKQIKL